MNSHCAWPTTDAPRPLNLRDSSDRAHLAYDARLAEELGVQYGDSFRGREPIRELWIRREACTEELVALVASTHGVTRDDVVRAAAGRDIRVDLVAVLLPVALLFAFASDFLALRVFRRFTPDEGWPRVVTLLVASLLASLVLLAVGEMWSWSVFLTGVAIFWLTALRRVSDRPRLTQLASNGRMRQ